MGVRHDASADGRQAPAGAGRRCAERFGGSPWAHLAPFGAIVRALQKFTTLHRLARTPVPEGVRWLAIGARFDMSPPVRSVPAHAAVVAVTVSGVGHLGILLSKTAITAHRELSQSQHRRRTSTSNERLARSA
jgi:hypothetical protein